ncbi:MAG: type II secretion system F family protein [Acidobacteriota bacterium]|nr:type II secretion system F family protein [Acidobacteriota bacterium]MDQ5871691.1 type II secretion system F family protein [Acidobacteriota bacterium]
MSPQFSVKTGWPDGSVAEESILAPDSKSARVEIERRGGHVFEVKRHGFVLPGGKGGRRGRVKMADFLVFNQELIALLKAGLPVVRSFEILLERQESAALRAVLQDVKDRVNSGASISDAFAEQGDIFPRLYWTSLKAGEKSGEIEGVLRRYLKYQKTIIAISRKVVSTLVYPAILILLSTVLIGVLMTFVIPKFEEFFADFNADLPLLTVVVVGIAGFLRDNVLWLFPAVVVAAWLGWKWIRTSAGRQWTDGVLLKLPFLGGLFQRFAITQFTRSLSTLLAGGTPLVPSLENAAEAIGNRHISRSVREVVPKVREGGELWQALDSTGIFTNLTIEMIKVGETSGALEEMLTAVSDFYDEEIDVLLGRVITLVEPAILVLMGGVIMTILLSVYLPIFRIMSQIKG